MLFDTKFNNKENKDAQHLHDFLSSKLIQSFKRGRPIKRKKTATQIFKTEQIPPIVDDFVVVDPAGISDDSPTTEEAKFRLSDIYTVEQSPTSDELDISYSGLV